MKPRWYEEGEEPDYRFTLANERTFLAWLRTALALIAGGVQPGKQFPPHRGQVLLVRGVRGEVGQRDRKSVV